MSDSCQRCCKHLRPSLNFTEPKTTWVCLHKRKAGVLQTLSHWTRILQETIIYDCDGRENTDVAQQQQKQALDIDFA